MSNFILTGLFTEGNTDVRFLSSVVERTLESIAFDCSGYIETKLEIIDVKKKGLNFIQQVLQAAKTSYENYGILILFVHADSDSSDDNHVFETKITPLLERIEQEENSICKNIVAIIPIQMTESWMLADKKLLKEEIGVQKSDVELDIHLNPESISNPKNVIENIIRLSKEDETKRKRSNGLSISHLYQIIGQKIELSELEKLSSYLKFKNSLIDKLRELNFYHK